MQEEIFLGLWLVESKLLHRLAKECAEHNQLHQKAEVRRSQNQAEQFVKLCIVDKCHPSMTGGCLLQGNNVKRRLGEVSAADSVAGIDAVILREAVKRMVG